MNEGSLGAISRIVADSEVRGVKCGISLFDNVSKGFIH